MPTAHPSIERDSAPTDFDLPQPPPPPRPFADNYVWRLMMSDGWVIVTGIFALLGSIFGCVGAVLTLGVITAFVGIPFALLGGAFLLVSVPVLRQRYAIAQMTLRVLRDGMAARGQIDTIEKNYNVRVNGRRPWIITYHYALGGQNYQGKVSTLNQPGPHLRPGAPTQVLYLPGTPEHHTLYPHP